MTGRRGGGGGVAHRAAAGAATWSAPHRRRRSALELVHVLEVAEVPPTAVKLRTAPTRRAMPRQTTATADATADVEPATDVASGERCSGSGRIAASPVATRKISGHGTVPALIPPARKHVEHADGDDEQPRHDAAGEEVVEHVAAVASPAVDRTQSSDQPNRMSIDAPRRPSASQTLELARDPLALHDAYHQPPRRPRRGDRVARRSARRSVAYGRTPVPTALLSVYDKSGIVELAQRPARPRVDDRVERRHGARRSPTPGVPVTDVAELTGFPAILGHRVVTLHPKVHGGILADPDRPGPPGRPATYGIEPIALVVVNLYPFADDPGIELIDIGGPAMVRAAAKNHAHVGVVVDPADYDAVLDELARRRPLADDDPAAPGPERRSPGPPPTTRRSSTGSTAVGADDADDADRCRPAAPRRSSAPSRCATARTRTSRRRATASTGRRAGGTRPSSTAARSSATSTCSTPRRRGGSSTASTEPACVIVKHANPCGVAVADPTSPTAYVRANACDPVSAFGGIVAVNRPVTAGAGRGAGAGVHRGRRGARRTTPTRSTMLHGQEEPAGAVGAAAPAPRRSTSARSTAACSCSSPTRSTLDRATWRVVTGPSPPTRASGDDLAVRLAGLRRRQLATRSSSPRTARRSASAPASRTGSTRRASPPTGPAGGPPAGCAPATPSSRSATASTSPPTPASPPSSSPAAASATTRSIAAADEHGIAMVFTGERHFRH